MSPAKQRGRVSAAVLADVQQEAKDFLYKPPTKKVRKNVLHELQSDAASFAGEELINARKTKPRGRRSPSPIKVKITRSAFAKIEAKKRQNAAEGVDQGAKL